jgi:hypothetical protein
MAQTYFECCCDDYGIGVSVGAVVVVVVVMQ